MRFGNEERKYDAFYVDGIYIPPRRRNWRKDPPRSWLEIDRVFKQRKVRTILDIGCGNCTFQQWSELRGYVCSGLEVTVESFKRFWHHGAKGVPLHGRAQDLRSVYTFLKDDNGKRAFNKPILTEISDGEMHAVRCMDILEHLPNDVEQARSAIRECARVCTKVAVFWSHTKYPSVEHPKYGNAHTLVLTDEQWFALYAEQFDEIGRARCEGRKTIWFGTPKSFPSQGSVTDITAERRLSSHVDQASQISNGNGLRDYVTMSLRSV